MIKINPKKLLNSKWTAVQPENKDKHFMVVDVEFDEQGNVLLCLIEALMSKRQHDIQWRDLKDSSQWKQGWK